MEDSGLNSNLDFDPSQSIKGKIRNVVYPQTYIDYVFSVWAKNDKPSMETLRGIIDVCSTTNTLPSNTVLGDWKVKYLWEENYDLIEIQTQETLNALIAKERADMMARHAQAAQDIQEKALEYLRDKEFESTNAALRALELGFNMERQSRGMGTSLVNIFNMPDKQVQSELESLLERLGPQDVEVIDGVS